MWAGQGAGWALRRDPPRRPRRTSTWAWHPRRRERRGRPGSEVKGACPGQQVRGARGLPFKNRHRPRPAAAAGTSPLTQGLVAPRPPRLLVLLLRLLLSQSDRGSCILGPGGVRAPRPRPPWCPGSSLAWWCECRGGGGAGRGPGWVGAAGSGAGTDRWGFAPHVAPMCGPQRHRGGTQDRGRGDIEEPGRPGCHPFYLEFPCSFALPHLGLGSMD